MRIRQSELRRAWHRKKEAYKLRLKGEGTTLKTTQTVRAAAASEKPAASEAKPKAAPRKKKTEEKTEE
jgi:hypothetical protein